MSSNIDKYLQTYAEQECLRLKNFPPLVFSHCLVIPCFDETTDFIKRLEATFCESGNILFIIVVNQPQSTSINTANQNVLQYFSGHFSKQWSERNIHLYSTANTQAKWLVVDRCEDELQIPIKQGVGLARKIGCDLASTLFHKQYLTSSWIHCSDADTLLPADYFNLPSNIGKKNTYSAAIYHFKHIAPKHAVMGLSHKNQTLTLKATQLYEQALNYYVAGLTWAGSPYNHHTIGSTLAYNVKAYCEVRGFPKRAAGEDFYLINKLRKTGPIYKATRICLLIEARCSERVPFGTGPAVEKIVRMNNPSNEYHYYSPLNFSALKQWLDYIPSIWNTIKHDQDPIEGLSQNIQEALEDAKIDKLFTHIKNQVKTEPACEKAIHDWFDGFQTLKFIRRLQDSTYPALPLKECIRSAPFKSD